MTPKEKAQELVGKFQEVDQPSGWDGITENAAIECAKIAVDEIINERENQLLFSN